MRTHLDSNAKQHKRVADTMGTLLRPPDPTESTGLMG
jgi:hypothetical protein